MEAVYYTVKDIRGDYAIMVSDEGIKNTVAMAFLPPETDVGSRILWENLCYTLVE